MCIGRGIVTMLALILFVDKPLGLDSIGGPRAALHDGVSRLETYDTQHHLCWRGPLSLQRSLVNRPPRPSPQRPGFIWQT
jgi:hypothetical protein